MLDHYKPLAQPYMISSNAVLAEATAFRIIDQASFDRATAFCKLVKTAKDAVEAKRVSIAKPLTDAHKAVQEVFREPLDTLAAAEKVVKQAMAKYADSLHQARMLEAQAGAVTLAPLEAPKGVSMRQVDTWTITDPGLVPRELCSPDPVKIRAAVKIGMRLIPGIVFSTETAVAVRK